MALAQRTDAIDDGAPARAAAELLRRSEARKSLLAFTQYTHPRYEAGHPHGIIAAECDKVLRGEQDRVMIMAPPRHGKTELATRRLPALALGIYPHWNVISAAAVTTLADDNGRDVRNILKSPEYARLFPDTRLSADSQAKGKWSTGSDGGYFAVGVEGAVMGKGGELIILDDLFATWADAQSPLQRKKVWDWYTGTIYNRQQAGGKIIIINHRMHEDDLCGRLLAAEKDGGDKWHVVQLPAVEHGMALWPERYPMPVLDRIKSVMQRTNLRAWSALYQQNPTPDDGVQFKREYFQYYSETPRDLNIYISGDFAVTPDGGDFTELAVWGVNPLGDLYALAWWSGQTASNVWVRQLVDMIKDRKPAKFIGEGGQIRRSVEPYLKKEMKERNAFATLEWLPSSANKSAMAVPFEAMCSNRRVYFPHTEWAEEVITQLLRFPGSTVDDKVDACSLMGRWLADAWAPPQTKEPVPVDFGAPLRIADIMKPKVAARW